MSSASAEANAIKPDQAQGESKPEVTVRRRKVNAANERLTKLEQELAELELEKNTKDKDEKVGEEQRKEIKKLKRTIQILKNDLAQLKDDEQAAQDDAVKNSKQVEVMYAAILILLVGSLATFANIGATIMLMFIVSENYIDSITNTYIAFFFSGGLDWEMTFAWLNPSFYFDFDVPSLSLFIFKTMLVASIGLEISTAILDFIVDGVRPPADIDKMPDFVQMFRKVPELSLKPKPTPPPDFVYCKALEWSAEQLNPTLIPKA